MSFASVLAAFAAFSPAFTPGRPFLLAGIPQNAVLKAPAGVVCERFLTRARCVSASAAQQLTLAIEHDGVSELVALHSPQRFYFDFPQLIYSAEAAAGRRCDAATDSQFKALIMQYIGLKSSQQQLKTARAFQILEKQLDRAYPALYKAAFRLIAVVYELSCREGLDLFENRSLAVSNVPLRAFRKLGIKLPDSELRSAVLDIMGSYRALRWGLRTGEEPLDVRFDPKGIDLQRIFDARSVSYLTAGLVDSSCSAVPWLAVAGLIGVVFAVLVALILYAGRKPRLQNNASHDC